MTELEKQSPRRLERMDVFERLDRLFDDWTHMMPFRRRDELGGAWSVEKTIHVDAYRENGTLVVRAELPGIDPEHDVELTVRDGVLRIQAERKEESKVEEKGYIRRELHRGIFVRSLPLPEGVSEADITATYKDGILEVRIPAGEARQPTKIPITPSAT